VCPPSLPSLASLLRSDHGFTHSASSTTVLIFRTSRFSMLSSSSPSVSHLHVIYLEYLCVSNAIGHIQLAIVCWKDDSFGGLGSAASLGLLYAWTHSDDHRPTVSGSSCQKNKASLSPTDGWDDEDAALSQGVAKKKKARSQANSDNEVCPNIFSLALVSPLMSYMCFLGVLRSPHPYLETLRPIRSVLLTRLLLWPPPPALVCALFPLIRALYQCLRTCIMRTLVQDLFPPWPQTAQQQEEQLQRLRQLARQEQLRRREQQEQPQWQQQRP
jgi:hypothetical protein